MSDLLKNTNIVVVEDDELTSQSLKHYFQDGNTVSVFGSAEDLLAKLDELSNTNLFIIDYRLPGIDGVELFQKLQHNFSSAKFICISGEMSMDLASRINEIGFDALILKPFDFSILEQNISSLTEA